MINTVPAQKQWRFLLGLMGGISCYLEKLNAFHFCIVVYLIFIDIGSLILKYVGQSSDDINLSIHVPPLYKQSKF